VPENGLIVVLVVVEVRFVLFGKPSPRLGCLRGFERSPLLVTGGSYCSLHITGSYISYAVRCVFHGRVGGFANDWRHRRLDANTVLEGTRLLLLPELLDEKR